MSRFYVSAAGQARTVATRRGSAANPTSAHVRGWDVGVRVVAAAYGDNDSFLIYTTGGSNGGDRDRLVGRVHMLPCGVRTFTPVREG